ncbi:hypothetical protein [Eubacterium coprostanoligenes]|uniref:hypothetical protein n=1 Tax=Eubacterium coprostanoligenes TaxID=290054 RepID=UPI0023556D7A|nr:hypothetical protein [Eubacterium coprostanoligenes]MCI6354200.1 hypothetical protein [Eubacterium coprostanoligenes]MCI6360953.1 hypothetical protein [Eubacterium coprostanoligenes]MCI7264572.1 hypothetical protein [Eubacterium coprostanoligenes]MDD7357711.1 hypothetical protein [Eubacterium coprostanoligenes]MDY4698233.1 hypothetical protein [Eubacterium coprostanoligenes]
MSRKMKHGEKLAYKYKFLREKIIESYRRGCKILNIVKIVFSVIFVIFSLIVASAIRDSSDKTVWLIWWVVIIFVAVTVFTITDYCKYLVKDKVIPYLLDDDQLEFGEYDIFKDDDDEEEEDSDE